MNPVRRYLDARRRAHAAAHPNWQEIAVVTTIRASCNDCGQVELRAADLRLVICSHPELSYYAFTCPLCLNDVRHPADEEIVALLLAGGVRPERWHIPAEALEAHAGTAITHDDLLTFVLNLDNIDSAAQRELR